MRRKGFGAVMAGAVLLIAAVVGFILVPEHKPAIRDTYDCLNDYTFRPLPASCLAGLSRTAYDAARIGTWAAVVVGTLLVVMGLIRYARPEVGR